MHNAVGFVNIREGPKEDIPALGFSGQSGDLAKAKRELSRLHKESCVFLI
jgi:hypothetical protein